MEPINLDIEPDILPVINSAAMQSVIRQMFDNVLDVNKSKGSEYSGTRNALANFERLARDLDLLPEKVLWVYATKHLDSIRSYINNLTNRVDGQDQLHLDLPALSEPIEARLMDVIAYMCLLTGQVARRQLQQEWLNENKPAGAASQYPDINVSISCSGGGGGGGIDPNAGSGRSFVLSPSPENSKLTITVGGTGASDSEDLGMTDREHITDVPAELTKVYPRPWAQVASEFVGPTIADVQAQEERLSLANANYGQLFTLHWSHLGFAARIEDQTIANSRTYRVLATRPGTEKIVVIDNLGQIHTMDLDTIEIYYYSANGLFPEQVLPQFEKGYNGGTLAAFQAGPLPSDFTASGMLIPENQYGRLLVDMNAIAYNEYTG